MGILFGVSFMFSAFKLMAYADNEISCLLRYCHIVLYLENCKERILNTH